MSEYEFITITETGRSASGKTGVFTIENRRSGDELGVIRWHGPWRQYVFYPASETLYSAGCLDDIGSFIRDARMLHDMSWRGASA